jgi:hypothetical protein
MVLPEAISAGLSGPRLASAVTVVMARGVVGWSFLHPITKKAAATTPHVRFVISAPRLFGKWQRPRAEQRHRRKAPRLNADDMPIIYATTKFQRPCK